MIGIGSTIGMAVKGIAVAIGSKILVHYIYKCVVRNIQDTSIVHIEDTIEDIETRLNEEGASIYTNEELLAGFLRSIAEEKLLGAPNIEIEYTKKDMI